ncbi:MAG: peptidoglycan bridge formation glycyltransferase FemA/FemB family protein [Bacilli bacterium]|nr:peptidoglycan bridge formation glycyltransferase FemA/FemB family protein [Bacilli bacterium]
MKIIEMQAEDFKKYASEYPYKHFCQTEEYGMLMDRHQFDDYYLGFVDESNIIYAATLILVNKVFIGYKWGYCPRGFLIDFNDFDLVKSFTMALKEYLVKRNFMFVKIDPAIIYKSRNNKGEEIPGINNEQIIENLKSLGYEHTGFNLNFENLKPRWNAVAEFKDTDNIFHNFSKEKRNKIRKAEKLGIEIIKGAPEDIRTFYDYVEKKHSRKLNYYLDMYEIFGKEDMFEIYFANLNTSKYVEKSKQLYEEEEIRNNDINQELENNTNSNNANNIIKRKMHSDTLLNNYKQNIVNATNLFREFPTQKIIASCAIIKYNKEIFILICGYDRDFKQYCPTHYMLYQIMEKYHREGYNRFHLNGISGDFNKGSELYGLTKFKLGFGTHIDEYIGEFTFVINKHKRKVYERLNPILTWLNTPVL